MSGTKYIPVKKVRWNNMQFLKFRGLFYLWLVNNHVCVYQRYVHLKIYVVK
jgi:hypothetical protein